MTADDLSKALVGFISFPQDALKRLEAIDSRLNSLDDRMERIERAQRADTNRDIHMSKGIDMIRQEVAETKDAVSAASTLITSLSARIREAAGNEAELEKLATELDEQNAALAKAVTDNTPFSPSGQ